MRSALYLGLALIAEAINSAIVETGKEVVLMFFCLFLILDLIEFLKKNK